MGVCKGLKGHILIISVILIQFGKLLINLAIYSVTLKLFRVKRAWEDDKEIGKLMDI